MAASLEFAKSHAFVLRAADVAAIWTAVQVIGQTTAQIDCKDDIKRTFDSAESLAAYSNPRARSIISLEFQARSGDYEQHVNVYCGGLFPFWVRATGPEHQLIDLRTKLTEIYDGMRPWYAAFARVSLPFVVAILSLFYVVFLGRKSLSVEITLSGKLSLLLALEIIGIAMASLLVMVVIAGFITVLFRRYFPMQTFAIGQGLERYGTDDMMRWTVFGGLFVSFLASFLLGV